MKLPMMIHVVAVSLSYASANCTPSLTEVNRTTAVCKEFSLVLECSTEGPGSTVFKGNHLNCEGTDREIVFLHSRFNITNGTSGTCNNGTILGYSLRLNSSSDCYISQLCIKTIQDADGEVIRCVYDDTTFEREVGNYIITTVAPSVPTQGNGKATTASTNTINSKVTNSLSGGEVEAIIICCSVILVGVMIIAIVLSICGFLFKKKQLHLPPVQTISNAHTSSTDKRQQTSTFHCAQNDEASGYTLCTMDYDRVVIITDDGEYSHLQHPTGQPAPGMRSRDLL